MYEALHYAVFINLLLFLPSYVQLLSSTPFCQTSSLCVVLLPPHQLFWSLCFW